MYLLHYTTKKNPLDLHTAIYVCANQTIQSIETCISTSAKPTDSLKSEKNTTENCCCNILFKGRQCISVIKFLRAMSTLLLLSESSARPMGGDLSAVGLTGK